MRRHPTRSLWPYFLLLATLFALSLAAPRSWRDDSAKKEAVPDESAFYKKVAAREREIVADATGNAIPDKQPKPEGHLEFNEPPAQASHAPTIHDVPSAPVLATFPAEAPIVLVSQSSEAAPDLVEENGSQPGDTAGLTFSFPASIRIDSQFASSEKKRSIETPASEIVEGESAASETGRTSQPTQAESEIDSTELDGPLFIAHGEDDHAWSGDSMVAEASDPATESHLVDKAQQMPVPATEIEEPHIAAVHVSDPRPAQERHDEPSQGRPDNSNMATLATAPHDAAGASVSDRWSWIRVPPKSLIASLDETAAIATVDVESWSQRVRKLVDDLHQAPPHRQHELMKRLEALDGAIDAAPSADEFLSPPEKAVVDRCRELLVRRLAVWKALVNMDGQHQPTQTAAFRVQASLDVVRQATSTIAHGAQWQQFLLLDELTQELNRSDDADAARFARGVVERFVDRVEHPDLTAQQRQMLLHEPFAGLHQAVLRWGATLVDLTILAKAIDAYETQPFNHFARRIAADARLLAHSDEAAARYIADVLDYHYRTPNLRLAVRQELLQRMMPKTTAVAEPVRDTIAGAAVSGRSITKTDVDVLLVPDESHWRIGLAARGNVMASTTSSAGPATLHSAGNTQYLGKKLLVITPSGLHSMPAVADAQAENMLRRIETSFDGIPLIESVVRTMVLKEHDQQRPRAIAQVEAKVEGRTTRQLDAKTNERLQQAVSRLRTRWLQPLSKLQLGPEATRMQTTTKRISGEFRLASHRQLTSTARRPYALDDSLMSIQVHQSALNNLVEQLGLAGESFTLPDLYQHVAEQLGTGKLDIPDDLDPDAVVRFARTDPMSIQFERGRVRITLSIMEIKRGRRRFRNFKVHAFYRPVVDRMQASLVRDDVIEIEGVRPAQYVVLQGIFVSLFSKDRPVTILPKDRNHAPTFDGLMVTQLVINNSWLGLSIGPQHASRTAIMTDIIRR